MGKMNFLNQDPRFPTDEERQNPTKIYLKENVNYQIKPTSNRFGQVPGKINYVELSSWVGDRINNGDVILNFIDPTTTDTADLQTILDNLNDSMSGMGDGNGIYDGSGTVPTNTEVITASGSTFFLGRLNGGASYASYDAPGKLGIYFSSATTAPAILLYGTTDVPYSGGYINSKIQVGGTGTIITSKTDLTSTAFNMTNNHIGSKLIDSSNNNYNSISITVDGTRFEHKTGVTTDSYYFPRTVPTADQILSWPTTSTPTFVDVGDLPVTDPTVSSTDTLQNTLDNIYGEIGGGGGAATVTTDGVTITGDGSIGDPLTLGTNGGNSMLEVLAWDTAAGRWRDKLVIPGPGWSATGTSNSITIQRNLSNKTVLTSTNGKVILTYLRTLSTPTASIDTGTDTVTMDLDSCEPLEAVIQLEDTAANSGTVTVTISNSLFNTSLSNVDMPVVQIYEAAGTGSTLPWTTSAATISVTTVSASSLTFTITGYTGGAFPVLILKW